jgi:hypothetical protein
MAQDITEDIPFSLSYTVDPAKWEPTNAAYDISINTTPFFLRVDNQTPYVRESAPFKKDQFDASNEPGEQSLTGWWLRSQTSWHEGAGIKYFEPGVEPTAAFRFKDSRGIDCWNIGELRMLPQVYTGYSTGTSGFHGCEANDGTVDCIIVGDSAGSLRKLKISSDENSMTSTTYNAGGSTTTITGHGSGTAYPVLSVTNDGNHYYAACSTCIHKGTIGANDDIVLYRYSASAVSNAFIKIVKGNLVFSASNVVYSLRTKTGSTASGGSATDGNHTGSSELTLTSNNTIGGANTVAFSHINDNWQWVDATSSATNIYVAGKSNGHSEIYAIGYDDALNLADFPGAQMAIKLPFGEVVNKIEYRLGSLIIATSKGIRICTEDVYGNLALGPLTFRCETSSQCYGITTDDNYAYVSTQATGLNGVKNAILVRVDLSNQMQDGTYPWAYDLEYSTSVATYTNEVFNINGQLALIVTESGNSKVQIEHTTKKVTSAYIDTGVIRYGTVEPKFFKYIKINGSASTGDYITISSFDEAGTLINIDNIGSTSINTDVAMTSISASREAAGFRFTFLNGTPYTTVPIMTSYQIKSLPASKRQRMIQLPLSCFDIEMDRYNSSAGYIGKAYEHLKELEAMEELGDVVTITDYRTDETYDALIENVTFSNESSPDKNNNGFGGTIIVTVRKLS